MKPVFGLGLELSTATNYYLHDIILAKDIDANILNNMKNDFSLLFKVRWIIVFFLYITVADITLALSKGDFKGK